jgi:glycosyltransferase involved in cell wall biosynthesis
VKAAEAAIATAGGERVTAASWVHVPTPGDHYSPATGSAVITVVYELARQHAQRGGTTRIVVGRGTTDGYPAYAVGELAEVNFGAPPGKLAKLLDVAAGRAGISRPFASRRYGPVAEAVSGEFAGPLLIHNAAGPVRGLRRRFPQARLCLYVHNELFSRFSRREAGAAVGAADRVVCCSQFVADRLQEKLGRRELKVRAVLNGVDVERFRPRDQGEGPAEAGDPVVLFVGRVLPEKGVDLLLKAARLLAGRGLRFRVRIVGSSNFNPVDPLTAYERELRELAAAVGRPVEFVPSVDRAAVVSEYWKADVFCAPSNWDEPFGLTVAEAMACGLPVVASRRGGIPEFGCDALSYFDPPDVEGLAARLEELLASEALRRERGARARANAEKISWERQYDRLAEALA